MGVPSLTSLSRRALAAGFALTLVACGGNDATDDTTAATMTSAPAATTLASAPVTEAVGTTSPSSAATDDHASTVPEDTTGTSASAAGTPAGAMRTVEGAFGPIDIPAEPTRIIGDLMALDYMTALGIDSNRFVGVFGASFFNDDHYLASVLQRDALLDPGFVFEANLEAIAAADPDLIVAPYDQIDGAPGLDAMREIAPVLVVPTSTTRDPGVRYGGQASFQDWRSTLRAFGTVLDRSAQAEAYIAETDALLAALRTQHGELIDSSSATEIKSTPDFVAINALSSARDAGVLGTILLSELGFQPPAEQATATIDEYGTIELSPEMLNLVDGDLLFVEVREDARPFESNPLWPTLRAVEEQRVFEVGNHWEYGGAMAARVVIADIQAALDDLASRS